MTLQAPDLSITYLTKGDEFPSECTPNWESARDKQKSENDPTKKRQERKGTDKQKSYRVKYPLGCAFLYRYWCDIQHVMVGVETPFPPSATERRSASGKPKSLPPRQPPSRQPLSR